jgi:hypothetical protein
MESPLVRLDFFGNRTRWFVIGLSVLLFAITNLPWHLDDYDQAKQAFTSFEMVREGHWLYQHTSIARIATVLSSRACHSRVTPASPRAPPGA